MKILSKQTENHLDLISIEVNKELFELEYNKKLDQAIKNVKISGFRTGKVPRNKALALVNHQAVLEATFNKLSQLVAQWIDEQESDEVKNIVGMAVKSELVSYDPQAKTCVLKLSYETLPEVTLGDFTKINSPQPIATEVTDAAVEAEINKQLVQNAMLYDEESAPATAQDVINFNFKGFLHGKPLANADAENYELDLENSNFIPGYAEQLVGLKKGDDKTFTIRFPANYHADNLKDQDVVFEVHVNAVKRKQKPTLTDEFVQSLNLDQVSNVAEYREAIVKQLTEQTAKSNDEAITRVVYQWAIDETINKLSHYPVTDIRRNAFDTIEQRKMEIEQSFQAMGGFKQYLQMLQMSEKDFEMQVVSEVLNNLKLSIVLEAVAKAAQIEVSEAEIQTANDLMHNQQNLMTKAQMQSLEADALKEIALQKKVLEFLKTKVIYDPNVKTTNASTSTELTTEAKTETNN